MARHESLARRPFPLASLLGLLGAASLLYLTAHAWAAPSSVPGIVPKWISAVDRGDRAVLAWVRDGRAASVRIYRSTLGPSPEFKLVGESRETVFTDMDVLPGGIYRYRLTAVGADGKEGRPSTEMTVRIVTHTSVPPVPPVWLGYLPLDKGVQLKWGEQEEADIIAYNVYRRIPPDTAFTLVGSVMGTSFTDSGVEPGTAVVYTVTALSSSFIETPFSEELPVVHPSSPPEGARKEATGWRARRTWLVALVGGGDQPFFRPADVAVGPVSGNVYVADSGRNRIFVFSAVGAFLRTIRGAGGEAGTFRRITGLCVDRNETVYAVDAGAGSVYAFDLLGGAGRRLPLIPPGRREAGLVDCAVGDEGGLFVVDNSNDLVLRAERSGAATVFGAAGFGPGEFSAPTFCATGTGGEFYVADTLNSRLQVFSGVGEFVRAFGRSRRGFGGMLRPKGVAVAPNGEIYVADSWQNSVQVFAATGEPLAVLTDEKGVPLDLGSPNGIALGAGNRIYIAERLSARLQIREIFDGAR